MVNGMVNGMVNVFKTTFRTTFQTATYTFNRIKPPRSFSWQMLLLLSIFSWILSLLAEAEWLSRFLTNGAWLFLISGVNWALLENPVRILGLNLGPWITGALVGLFLFGQGERLDLQVVLVLWPLISSAIAIFPYFLSRDLRLIAPNTKAQQQIVLLILINLILSCWIQVYFSVQRWLNQYPSLLVSDFQSSAFVLTVGDVDAVPRGVPLLEQIEALILSEIDDKPWSYTERWLFQIDNNLPELRTDALSRLSVAKEDHFWSLQHDVRSAGSDYDLNLRAIWTGPGTQAQPYALQETCQIRQIQAGAAVTAPGLAPRAIAPGSDPNPNSVVNNTPMTEVVCSEISEVPVEPVEPPASAPDPATDAAPAPTTPTDSINPSVPPAAPAPNTLTPTPAPPAPVPIAPAPSQAGAESLTVPPAPPAPSEPINFGAPPTP